MDLRIQGVTPFQQLMRTFLTITVVGAIASGCAIIRPSTDARCQHHIAAAHAALGVPPDSTGGAVPSHDYAREMSSYHACTAVEKR